MPRNRADIDRGEKVTEILDTAESLVRAGGMSALTVAGVARELGITGNAVYWYFPRREDLCVAVLERLGRRVFASKPRRTPDWRGQILWLVDQMSEIYPYAVSLQESAPRSPVIADFEVAVTARFREMLAGVLADRMGEDDSGEGAALFLATVFGCYALRLPQTERRRLLDRLLDHLVTDAS